MKHYWQRRRRILIKKNSAIYYNEMNRNRVLLKNVPQCPQSTWQHQTINVSFGSEFFSNCAQRLKINNKFIINTHPLLHLPVHIVQFQVLILSDFKPRVRILLFVCHDHMRVINHIALGEGETARSCGCDYWNDEFETGVAVFESCDETGGNIILDCGLEWWTNEYERHGWFVTTIGEWKECLVMWIFVCLLLKRCNCGRFI